MSGAEEVDPEAPYDENAPACYAHFERSFYGSPFISRSPDGKPVMVIEDNSGCPSVRPISERFAEAWMAEFKYDRTQECQAGTGTRMYCLRCDRERGEGCGEHGPYADPKITEALRDD